MSKLLNSSALSEAQAESDPLLLFSDWFKQACQVIPDEANAMSLATVTPSGQPTARIVLLKNFGIQGFTFYTNYESPKARQLQANSRACLLFYWSALKKQIRIEGEAELVSEQVSAAYFATRPRESQIGAYASAQSATLSSREELEDNYRRLEKEFEDKAVPCPAYWGGYLLVPHSMEFWQGRLYRLHDRLLYTKSSQGWICKRLAP